MAITGQEDNDAMAFRSTPQCFYCYNFTDGETYEGKDICYRCRKMSRFHLQMLSKQIRIEYEIRYLNSVIREIEKKLDAILPVNDQDLVGNDDGERHGEHDEWDDAKHQEG